MIKIKRLLYKLSRHTRVTLNNNIFLVVIKIFIRVNKIYGESILYFTFSKMLNELTKSLVIFNTSFFAFNYNLFSENFSLYNKMFISKLFKLPQDQRIMRNISAVSSIRSLLWWSHSAYACYCEFIVDYFIYNQDQNGNNNIRSVLIRTFTPIIIQFYSLQFKMFDLSYYVLQMFSILIHIS